MQFRNKAEAQQAIQDMEKRVASAAACANVRGGRHPRAYRDAAAEYADEAERIRRLLPNLPD